MVLRYVHVPNRLSHLYERSTCRYVRINALKVLHVHGPCSNAPWREVVLVVHRILEGLIRVLLYGCVIWSDQIYNKEKLIR